MLSGIRGCEETLMALPDLDSSAAHSFGLELDGIHIKQIGEVSGLTIEQDMIELEENTPDGNVAVRRVPGRPKAGEVTLTRGLTADHGFEKWIKEFRSDQTRAARKSGSIVIYDYDGTPITSYSIINAWPKKLTIGTLKAGDTSVLTETLVVAYESLDVE
jgi:phage tail-like protein